MKRHCVTIVLLASIFGAHPVWGDSYVRYVDDSATGQDDGTNWTDAWTDLQSALTTACNNPNHTYEIHVGQGTYVPDECDPPGECTSQSSERTSTFQICSNVYLMGGLAGTGAQNPDERDIGEFPTILSGDLNANDDPQYFPNDSNMAENSFHVVNTTMAYDDYSNRP